MRSPVAYWATLVAIAASSILATTASPVHLFSDLTQTNAKLRSGIRLHRIETANSLQIGLLRQIATGGLTVSIIISSFRFASSFGDRGSACSIEGDRITIATKEICCLLTLLWDCPKAGSMVMAQQS